MATSRPRRKKAAKKSAAAVTPAIRDRIVDFRRVKAKELMANPKNWRTHSDRQRAAVQGILAEVGYVNTLIARQTPRGLELLDGHLRAQTTPDAEVPVVIVDLTDEEADKILATFDPVGAMAGVDNEKLESLLAELEVQDTALSQMLEELAAQAGIEVEEPAADEPSVDPVPETYQVMVTCRDEEDQQAVYERLSAEGYSCKVLTL